MRAWGAGRSRGRRENLERVETWAFALTEASPRIARLDEVWLSVVFSLDEGAGKGEAHKPTMSSWRL